MPVERMLLEVRFLRTNDRVLCSWMVRRIRISARFGVLISGVANPIVAHHLRPEEEVAWSIVALDTMKAGLQLVDSVMHINLSRSRQKHLLTVCSLLYGA
jgi:hypothetical protein